MDVAAVILEDGAILRVREALAWRCRGSNASATSLRFLGRVAVDVDPEQLLALEPLGPVAEIVELLDLVAIEEDWLRSRSARTRALPFETYERHDLRRRGAFTTTRFLRISAGIEAIERTPSTTGPSCRSISSRRPKRSSALVDEEDRAGALGGVEPRREVLLGLADVLRDDLRRADDRDARVPAGGEQFLQLVHS